MTAPTPDAGHGSLADVFARLGSSPRGLTSVEAARRQQEVGPIIVLILALSGVLDG